MRCSLLVTLGFLSAALAGALCAQTVEFNRDIRPILSDKCFTCHGPDAANRKTKLRFDLEPVAKSELRKGVRAIAPGDPIHSEMFRRITSTNKAMRMPPAYAGKEKLTDRQIDLIRRWIEQGAPWEPFWSFIPPRRAPLPVVEQRDWPRNPIDFFVLSRLQREHLHPSAEADRRTLIRRVSLDLTGLPPTPSEVDAFVEDTAPNAYEKVVDRLLASPEYAERMAFRWMEAARYGDTNGYQTDGPRQMWRWRDWVIDAFRRNMPYDRFVLEQLAGDLLPDATVDQRIATGFNRNHRTSGEGGIIPEEFRVEYVADRAQTTGTVFMGLTVGCARCHDHKYDPISQKDFYRLFAYFNRIPNEKGFAYNYGNEEPYIAAPLPEQKAKLVAYDRDIAEAERAFAQVGKKAEKEQCAWEKHVRKAAAADWKPEDGLVFRSTETVRNGKVEIAKPIARFGYLDPFTFAARIRPETGKGGILSQAEDYFEGTGHSLYLIDGKLRLHIVQRWTDLALRVETADPLALHEWRHVLVTYDGKRKAAGVHIYVDGVEQKTNVLFDQLNEPFHVSESVPFRIGSAGGVNFSGSIEDVRVYRRALTSEEAAVVATPQTVSALASIPAPQRTAAQAAKLRLAYFSQGASASVRKARRRLLTLKKERDAYFETIPTVMVMVDDDAARESFLLKRGAYDNPGEKVLAGVPEVLPQLKPEWPNNRLGLAKWIIDRSNPLTARVAVNRYWQSLFGTGIVKTVDDFGSQGEWPVHPELLDWLAVEFMDSGWDVKAIQKLMVMSATYRQSSAATPELLNRDPENRLLAHGPHLRLGPEVIRDQALAASGLLVRRVGGPSVKPYQPQGLWQELAGGGGYVQDHGDGLYRRSLYTYWKRTVTPPFMANFDSPNREVCTVYESRTNTPLQALNLMNDVAFLEASRKLAERLMREGGATPAQRIDYAYRLLMARDARPEERAVVLQTLQHFEAKYKADPKAAKTYVNAGESPRASRVDAGELAAYTAVASLLMNLDETVSKN